jgi:glycosyltransferase involved in cell wall biosynthesis
MRILIVNHHMLDVPGGSETQCHEIATRLLKRGHSVTYAVCRPGRQSYDVPYATYPLRGSLPAAFKAALTELKPDVVYWRRNKRYLLRCVRAARRRGVKFVYAVSSISDVELFTRRHVDENASLLRRAGRALVRVVEATKDPANYYALSLVDGVVFQHSGQIPRRFRGRHEIIYNSYPQRDVAPAPSTKPYVLWVGNVKKRKNPEHFVRLAADLGGSGVEFWMVGGIQDSAYQALLDDARSLPASFRYLGRQSQDSVDSLMKGSLFVVSTSSTDEGFPNVFIQAWLQRKPVVSLYFDPDRLLATQKIGICSGDYDTFRSDVARLIEDAELRQSMGERAARFATERCDPDTNIRQLESFLVAV